MDNELSLIKAFDAVRKAAGAMSFRRDLKALWRTGSSIEMRPNLQRMLIDPMMRDWFVKTENRCENKAWSHHTQGVACDGRNWFVASTPYQDPRKDKVWLATTTIFRMSLDLNTVDKTWMPTAEFGKHLGCISLGSFRGEECIFAPFEESEVPIGRVVVLNRNLEVLHSAFLKCAKGKEEPPPTHAKMPWCAVHPGNGLLYTSKYDEGDGVNEVRLLHAFDPNDNFHCVPDAAIELDRKVQKVQGGCFNLSGHVFLSCAETAEVLGFSAFTGKFLGSVSFEMHPDFHELAEGLCWAPLLYGDTPCALHLVLLDQDVPQDDIFVKHFATGAIQ